MRKLLLPVAIIILVFIYAFSAKNTNETSWIRINLLGYQPNSSKVAVWCSKENKEIKTFQLIHASTKKIAFNGSAGKNFGAFGPFTQTYRLNFSSFVKPGKYYLQAGGAKSPVFEIGDDVYKGSADFCLRYMRQQRTGFNPFLKDSCHTRDGYVLYGEKAGIPDSSYVDVVGGWHDASDYLQYSTTSANATYHLLMAYRDFPQVFGDEKLANGLDGKNQRADVLDEAKWGLDWLLKMHPRSNWMFNQIADDRDHISMRIPKMDSQYGRGYQRPVYFINGEPQQRGKFLNNTTGTSSTAAKFASAFALGANIFFDIDSVTAINLTRHFASALTFAYNKRGVTQTASVKAPYIYAEDNWVDDMELGYASAYNLNTSLFNKQKDPQLEKIMIKLLDSSFNYARHEPITPWLGDDTAKHYQWYPFINLGHYELAKQLKDKRRDTVIGFYKEGIQRVWNKARQNAFYRGIPFIWCSNNLTTSFAIQCYWYQQLTGDKQYEQLEQANFDWLFGCNPWGTSMVYGLPSFGDTPIDPHSAFTHLGNYPIDGGLVDGPVYTSIYKNLIGIKLYNEDEYAPFQSDLAVYHDDYGDYSTNEPTMDGTASLIYLLAAKEAAIHPKK
ncbi:MAG TPA: glycoside hydrolase family 9 protein [Flavisolibacter sp.]